MLKKSAWVSLSVALLIASGCGRDATGPAASGPGTFSAQVSGAVNTSYSGPARFGVPDGWLGLQMTAVPPSAIIQVLSFGQGRPGVGNHPLGIDGGLAAVIMLLIAGEGFGSESGTLRITASSADRLAGTLEFEGVEEGSGRRVTVTASFDALCASTCE